MLSSLRVNVLGYVSNVWRAVDSQLSQFKYLTFGVGYFALNCASVSFLNRPKDYFINLIALFSAAETIIEGISY